MLLYVYEAPEKSFPVGHISSLVWHSMYRQSLHQSYAQLPHQRGVDHGVRMLVDNGT